jgi:hypothetical protein
MINIHLTEYFVDYVTVVFDFLQPTFDIGERVSTGDIVHYYHSVGSPVVRARYRSEPLLAGRVPYLKFHPLTLDDDRPYFKINANCRYVTAGECVVGKPQQQRTLTDA